MPGNPDQASSRDFVLLGLGPGAPPEQVKKAYKAFVKRWHPDRFPQGSHQQRVAEERLKDGNAAYRRIRNSWADAIPESKSEKRSREATDASEGPAEDTRRNTGWSSAFASHPAKAFDWIRALFRSGVPKTRYRKRTIYGAWILTVLTLCLLALLVKMDPLSLDNARRDRSPEQPFHAALVVPPAPLPPEAPEAAKPPEMPMQSDNAAPVETFDLPVTSAKSDHADPNKLFFTVGSSQKDVLRIQGKPSRIYGQTWVYGLSDVTFREGKVWRYRNFDGTLQVRILPSTPVENGSSPGFFSLGSGKDEVLKVQGTPTHVEGNKWSYGFSEVYFKDGVVSGFNNFFNDLNIVMRPSSAPEAPPSKNYFTLGSTRDEVLSIQGTPTVVQGNVWSYQLSEIQFLDGRVRNVNNFSDNLKFLSPDLTAEN